MIHFVKCPRKSKRKESISQESGNRVEFLWRQGVLTRGVYRRGDTTVRERIVSIIHCIEVLHVTRDTPKVGHLSSGKTLAHVTTEFYWPGMAGNVTRYCQFHYTCQRVNHGKVSTIWQNANHSHTFLSYLFGPNRENYSST